MVPNRFVVPDVSFVVLLALLGCGKIEPVRSVDKPGRAAVAIVNTPGTAIALTAQRMTTQLRDGSSVPMWGFCTTGSCTTSWAPGPTIVATAGTSLQIALTNSLPVPTSLVVPGQLGGGLGAPSKMASPVHSGQNFTTFPNNVPVNTGGGPAFVPPTQAPRVRSFGAEVSAADTVTLTWSNLQPGTYLYETGTLPSLEVPMGLYGVLVVTVATGQAYPGVAYDDDGALLFSELDPVQNAAVDAAAQAGADVNLRFNDPACTSASPCYPAAVNYAPTTFFINGKSFDATAPMNTALTIGDTATYATGNVLLRLLNAGSRTHVPALVGLPMSLVAEDGNPLPGLARVQSEILLTAGKTVDVMITPAADATTPTAYASATLPVFDRSGSLSSSNKPLGGMLGYVLLNHAAAATTSTTVGGVAVVSPVPGAPGNLPAAITPTANADTIAVPFNTATSGDVTTNDFGVTSVALVTGPSSGTLTLDADGTFTYTPNTGFSGADSFTYSANGSATLTAVVTLNVAAQLTGPGNTPLAVDDAFTSPTANRFSVARPGVLANDTDPNGFPLSAGSATSVSGCAQVTLDGDGSFTVAPSSGATSCVFTYLATNSQGTASAAATVTVTFGAASNLAVTVIDAASGSPLTDYRWTLQEDLTFKHATTATPAINTRTVGTSFHRSHMTVVATGCVGPISCGSGQSVLDSTTGTRVVTSDADAVAKQTTPDQTVLDPTRRYYLSVLPGSAGTGGNAMSGGEVTRNAAGWAPMAITVQGGPLPPAQMSIYTYEDSAPTNGQDEPNELPLGGFNIILFDPAGRTGDVAGQQTYDAFNMPLSNSLLGRPGCPDDQNKATNGTGTSGTGNAVGVIYTCPNDPNEGTNAADPVKYALAGHALIKNLTPARYDVVAHPGAAREGAGEVWWQTETLEGTQAQDAFVGLNEPVYFQEFGPPGPHVTIGFVSPGHVAATAQAGHLTGSHVITGKITNQHMSHPSNVTLYDSSSYDLLAATTCRVVLNSQAGNGPAISSAQCAPDGTFTLTGVPAGDYDLAIFDQWLDQIIQNTAVSVPSNATTVAMGTIPVLSWFTQYDQNIYLDSNGNGQMDPQEPGISNVPLTVRFRDGSISNRTQTDSTGNGILAELFPLFNWYVAEADTTRFKQTGVHVIVDSGGKPNTTGSGAGLWTSTYPTGQSSDRVDLGTGQDPRPATLVDGSEAQPASLTYGLQGFISQRNRVEWGRATYVPGENGGVTGTVVYASTRPFDDMRFNVQNIWEPLVPRVTVNLYWQHTLADGTQAMTLVDTTLSASFDDYVNLVFGADGQKYQLATDGTLRDPTTGASAPSAAYPAGKQVNVQCPGQLPGTTAPAPWNTAVVDPFTSAVLSTGAGTDQFRCYDGWHNWNQIQAAPYDGLFNFPSKAYIAAHPLTAAQKLAGQTLVSLPVGTYVVEAVTPPGYEVVKEEDKNILIGDAFIAPVSQQFGALTNIFILPDQATIGTGQNAGNPGNPNTGDPGFQSDPTSNLGNGTTSAATSFPPCVGALHRVPDYLSLYPQAQQVAPFAGMDRPLCDRKQVVIGEQMQTSANFFIYTQVPTASNNTGIILDDATSEFNAFAPDFGEKASVPFVPVSVKDYTGREIGRTYADQWGAYNMMTPSSWLVNPPTPSGFGPQMLITCINDPGPITDPATGKLVTDPAYDPGYSNFCYTNPYMPGQTTYLDTPVLPIAAFAAGYNPPDCAQPPAAPAIARVDTNAGFGPWLPSGGGTVTITAQGDQQVLNPAYSGPFAAGGLASQRTVTRHYGFGTTAGKVLIGNVDLTSAATWNDGTISVAVPANTPSGTITITTAAGLTSVDTVTLTVGGRSPTRVSAGASIQAAIDTAQPGDLILVDAGTYDELVVMWKPVRLQGVGAASVIINAAKFPNSRLDQWRPLINSLFSVDAVSGNQVGTAQVDPLPTQEITGGVVLLEPSVLGSEEGAGITVLAKNLPARRCSRGATSTFGHDVTESNFRCAPSRIDGISVTGGDAGGGIYVNGWAHNLEISNNRVYGNAGAYNGGIRVGVPYLELEALPPSREDRVTGLGYDLNLKIHHNAVTRNGAVEGAGTGGGAGGGISISAGTDNYSVDHNFVCGNISSAHGGGIGHLGFSQGGTIAFNQILFNQSFQQTNTTHGGGIAVVGEPPIAGTVSLGTGDLVIDANVIRGNVAEGGQGGGIRLDQVNGADVALAPTRRSQWHHVTITNNLIVDNIAGWAGGGISMTDALNTSIVNNTIASNDSVGIAGVVLAGGVPLPGTTGGIAGVGTPSAAGLATGTTSAALLSQVAARLRAANTISQPDLFNDIFWQNRSFFYSGDGRLCASNNRSQAGCATLPDQATTGQCVAGAAYWDLGVVGDASAIPGATRLTPTSSIITSTAGYPGNLSANPQFVNQYCNGARVTPELGTVINPPGVLNLQVAATADEGNNYVNLRYGPLATRNPSTGAPFGDYHLLGSTSPAYNAGTGNGAPAHDVDGQHRPYAIRWDLGADEWRP
jgi:hypothetical protein